MNQKIPWVQSWIARLLNPDQEQVIRCCWKTVPIIPNHCPSGWGWCELAFNNSTLLICNFQFRFQVRKERGRFFTCSYKNPTNFLLSLETCSSRSSQLLGFLHLLPDHWGQVLPERTDTEVSHNATKSSKVKGTCVTSCVGPETFLSLSYNFMLTVTIFDAKTVLLAQNAHLKIERLPFVKVSVSLQSYGKVTCLSPHLCLLRGDVIFLVLCWKILLHFLHDQHCHSPSINLFITVNVRYSKRNFVQISEIVPNETK